MRTIGTYILRALWLFLLFAWIWNLASGRAVKPLHPFNLILTAAVLIGALTVWLSAPRARMLSGICGILAACMMGFQFLTIMTMFTSDTKVEFRASIGPFDLQGGVAQAVLWLPPFLLLVLSAVMLFSEIRSNVLHIQEGGGN